MTLAIDLFWSFRSPYSYLATPRLVGLAAEYDLDIAVRLVLPLAVRDPSFFTRVNPLWPPYVLRDTMRIAQYNGIEYGWPRPDPIVQDFVTQSIAPEQPYIHRLTRLGEKRQQAALAVGDHRGEAIEALEKRGAPLDDADVVKGRVPPRLDVAHPPQ